MNYKGKWKDIEINKSERNKIYSRLRIKANTILKKRHKKEYSDILRNLLKKELNKIFRYFKKKNLTKLGGEEN